MLIIFRNYRNAVGETSKEVGCKKIRDSGAETSSLESEKDGGKNTPNC
jgi:hypothetical protein